MALQNFSDRIYYSSFEGREGWSRNKVYQINDLVEHNDNIYTAIRANTGVSPSGTETSNDDWMFRSTVADTRLGYYQYIGLDDLIDNFMFAKTGEDSLIGKVNRNKVAYHIQRCIQELNYDVLRVEKSFQQELNTDTRSIAVPHDLVNLIQVNWIDGAGNKHPMIEAEASGSSQDYFQDDQYRFTYDNEGKLIEAAQSGSSTRFQEQDFGDRTPQNQAYFYGAGFNDYEYPYSGGYLKRYGLEPQDANENGLYLYDRTKGIIYFDDSLVLGLPNNEQIIISMDYITDGLADDTKIQINKMVEAAIYKMVEYEILSNKFGVQDYVLRRVKKESNTMMRNTKIRLMKLNFQELSQAVRAQSKWIKH